MKKMLPMLLRWPCLIQDVNRRLPFKTNRQQQLTKGNPSPIIVSGTGQKKTVDAAKTYVAAQKIPAKQETQQTFVNGLLGFILL